MRIGFNPNKDKKIEVSEYFHQVIIPVYIPNEEGYFKDSFQIFKYCLESLFKTSHKKTFFTIVNNGSCNNVINYLNTIYEKGEIQEIVHTSPIGKVNAILKGIMGHKFDLITITDADVLFLDDWQKETYNIFESFPKAGMVSTTPNPKMIRYFTSNIFFDRGLSNQMRFTNVKDSQALEAFAKSIGNIKLYNKFNLKFNLTLSNNNINAVIGAGHFVGTYRGDIFNNLNVFESKYSLGGDSEIKILDEPIIDNGYWRLSTESNFTYHMGNTIEIWMLETLKGQIGKEFDLEKPILHNVINFRLLNYIKNNIFHRIIFNERIWQFFIKYKRNSL